MVYELESIRFPKLGYGYARYLSHTRHGPMHKGMQEAISLDLRILIKESWLPADPCNKSESHMKLMHGPCEI